MNIKFTEKQGQYLSFIQQYTKVNRKSPSEADIQRYFQVTPPTVHQMIVKLESIGLITKKSGVPRSIQILIDENSIPPLK